MPGDLIYTLGERRSHLPLRGYIVAKEDTLSENIGIDNLRLSATDDDCSNGKFAFVFTGQGAQWKGMARELMQFATFARTIRQLDEDLASLPFAPSWKIYDIMMNISEDCPINQAEFAQPITTALQIGIVDLLQDWSISAQGTVGHSSGEISAAYAAGLLSAREAIFIAYYRGYVIKKLASKGSMAAAGLGPNEASEYINKLELGGMVKVACINSPESVTLSGDENGIDTIVSLLQEKSIFVRKLKTDGKAYHSHHMAAVGSLYEELLTQAWKIENECKQASEGKMMFSSVICDTVGENEVRMPSYWRKNLESPVHFSEALTGLSKLIKDVTFVEIGPHSALKMPLMQNLGRTTPYLAALNRGKDSSAAILGLVGDMFTQGFKVDFTAIRKSYGSLDENPKVLWDMPSYSWHYDDEPLWNESRLSRESRYRKYPRHELLGAAISGGNKTTMSWHNLLQLDHVPWLRDHKLGDTIVFPGAGYMAMAAEALMQTRPPDAPTESVLVHHLDLLQALSLTDDEPVELYTELRPVALTNVSNSKDWWEFKISSVLDDVVTVRANGSIRFESMEAKKSLKMPISDSRMLPRVARPWYDSMTKGGLDFGPSFRHVEEFYVPDPKGATYSQGKISSVLPVVAGTQKQSRYLLHPTLLDSLLQVALVSCTGGFVNSMVARVPTRVGDARITAPMNTESGGMISADSEVIGLSSNRANSVLVDDLQRPLAHFQDIDVTKYIGNETMEVRHPLLRLNWKLDLDTIEDSAVFSRAIEHTLSVTGQEYSDPWAHVLAAIELIVHKNADTNILCICPNPALVEMAVLGALQCTSYFRRCRSFSLGRLTPEQDLELAEIRNFAEPLNMESLTYRRVSLDDQFDVVILPEDASVQSFSGNTTQDVIYLQLDAAQCSLGPPTGFSCISSCGSASAQGVRLIRCLPGVKGNVARKENSIIHICESPADPTHASIGVELSDLFGVPVQQIALKDVTKSSFHPDTLVISTVELEKTVMAGIGEENFAAVQYVVERAKTLVWITGSGAHHGFDPTLSLFPGLARAIMIEQPATKIFNLELDPKTDATTLVHDISIILEQAQKPKPEHEYLKNEVGLLISRAVPDEQMNQHFRNRWDSVATLQPLGKAGLASLSLAKSGQLSTAQFIKKPMFDVATLGADRVIIKVHAFGLNAKDVYALAGRMNTTDATCSLEFTGEIIAIGSAVSELIPGDKVAVMHPSHFSTYENVPHWSCIKLRDDEDLTVYASVLLVFMTAIYALQHRAQLQAGESVLIHSAAGGVGIAAIQIAKIIGAEIYATVGSDEKKQYLIETFGLPSDHVFQSRLPGFATDIKATTGGRGVDVILNSLLGDRLHESWDCLADFGRFVEIGKRDIIDGGRLSMEPLSRSTTFTAFDISMSSESKVPAQQRVISSLVSSVLQYMREGRIQPIKPLAVFNVANVAAAFHHFNSSKRMGKIVISFEDQSQLIPVVPEKYSTILDPHKSYLLVGCLGGLGRSLSKWMLNRGARNFVFIGRSGTEKPAAKRLVDKLEKDGAKCIVVTGDVTNYDDVVKAINAAPSPLGGVVQAAMGLNQAIFNAMTQKHWLTGTEAKVKGTWNLHNALSKLGKENLDFFLMTSSISGKVGTATEGNYCAANNFLDTFSRYRRSLGLSAISVGLGMISEVGYLHENPEIEDLLLRKGMRPINEDELLQIFDLALSHPPTSANPKDLLSYPHILTGLEFTGKKKGGEQSHIHEYQFFDDARFSTLESSFRRSYASSATQGAGSESAAIVEALASNDKEALATAVKTFTVKKLSSMILMPIDKFDFKISLSSYGMDSMLAAELRQYIFSMTGVDISFLVLMDKKTNILTLSTLVAEKLLSQ